MMASVALRKGLLLAVAATGLAACGGDMDDLDSYINEVKARPGGRIEPLPEITPYEVFNYVADVEGWSGGLGLHERRSEGDVGRRLCLELAQILVFGPRLRISFVRRRLRRTQGRDFDPFGRCHPDLHGRLRLPDAGEFRLSDLVEDHRFE